MIRSCLATPLFIMLFAILSNCSIAQTDTIANNEPAADSAIVPQHIAATSSDMQPVYRYFNLVKTNLTSILLKNYSLQYERILSRKFSVALQYRIMPESGLPFKNSLAKLADDNDDPDTKKLIEDFRMSNYAITPEARFYLSKKGYGQGFYIGIYYRYASFTSDKLDIFYTDDQDVEQSIRLSGKLTGNTGGFLLGAQRFWGKRVVFDMWMLGPHYGSGQGTFSGTSGKPLSMDEQNDLRDQLNDIDIPLTDKTVQVDANGASLKLDGPWAGLRIGLSLGIRF